MGRLQRKIDKYLVEWKIKKILKDLRRNTNGLWKENEWKY